jgi:hypothetical protein
MENIELAYIAGVMDSDGYFTIKRGTYAIRVTGDSKNPTYCERVGIKQVQSEAVYLIHDLFGGYLCVEKPNCKNGKPLHSLQISNLKAHAFVCAILPFLRLKREQALILLELRESLKKGRTEKNPITQKSRWGTLMDSARSSVSQEDVEYREMLLSRIKNLNDSRTDAKHQPKAWK